MSEESIVLVSARRTPMGSFQGDLSSFKATDLGSIVVKQNLEDTKLSSEDIDEVIIGCVLPAGLGQAPARQVSIGAGIPVTVGATTINKMCGSGMRSLMLAVDQLIAGSSSVTVAGGFESMTNAPYLLDKARSGYRMGNNSIYDHMFLDGLEDSIESPGKLMGSFAEDTAQEYQFTREQQDNFAIESLRKAKKANEDGSFQEEIVPIKIKSKKSEITIDKDELPFKAKIDKIPQLKPAFKEGGSVTAANSSAISDGAAALVLMMRSTAEKKGYKPLAKVLGHATQSQEASKFTTAPIGAINKLYEKVSWSGKDVDLYEINEAFAVVTMAAMRDLNLDQSIVNINGGACALGHPIGASGSRIVVTLYNALRKHNLSKGIASLCIGGGEATALAIELIAA